MTQLTKNAFGILFVIMTSLSYGQGLEIGGGEVYRPSRQPTAATIERAIPNSTSYSNNGLAHETTSKELAPPSSSKTGGSKNTQWGPFSSMAGSLALVLAAFGISVWFLRKANHGKGKNLPKGAFEVLGQASIAPRHQALLVRVGDRVLLLSLSPTGTTTLAEFKEGPEVHRLVALCKTGESGSFQDALQELGNQRHAAGFVSNTANLFG